MENTMLRTIIFMQITILLVLMEFSTGFLQGFQVNNVDGFYLMKSIGG